MKLWYLTYIYIYIYFCFVLFCLIDEKCVFCSCEEKKVTKENQRQHKYKDKTTNEKMHENKNGFFSLRSANFWMKMQRTIDMLWNVRQCFGRTISSLRKLNDRPTNKKTLQTHRINTQKTATFLPVVETAKS